MAAHAIGGKAVELAGPFDAQIVGFRIEPGLLKQESPLARADFNLERIARMIEPSADQLGRLQVAAGRHDPGRSHG